MIVVRLLGRTTLWDAAVLHLAAIGSIRLTALQKIPLTAIHKIRQTAMQHCKA